MDYDRKSATSSFYGGRKTSIDALHSDFPASAVQYGQPHAERARHDSASSFYNPNGPSRASVDISSPGYSTAGYNRKSYFPAGRQEPVKGGYDEETTGLNDEPFDIYADFNNQGPRYSTVLGHQDSGYRPVSSPALKMNDEGSSNAGPVEMVTVPALGPEWKASELRDMTKSGRKEAKREQRAEKWKQWKRGERGLCGRYFTRKFTAWFLFVLVCAFVPFSFISTVLYIDLRVALRSSWHSPYRECQLSRSTPTHHLQPLLNPSTNLYHSFSLERLRISVSLPLPTYSSTQGRISFRSLSTISMPIYLTS